ncbi:DDB1- and CUL4-associated factor 5 [Elysia marginata]|uniref:DDB1- and CUL4-associated factor 5 n=1 Tax=Elysia marginata TaxID=1093978 RepID=A0AAV4H440_9GAST|nr:DDB1- and CUL4-associated factor 5 [Elysia marginata]
MWSPYSIPGCTGHLVHSRRYGDDDEIERDAYSHEEYIHMVLQAGSFLSHDYTNGTIDEEPCMIAFFDSLIQREIEQTVDDKDDEDDEDNNHKSGEGSGNDKDSDDGSGGGGEDDDGGGDDDDDGGGGSRGVNGANDAPLCRDNSSMSLTTPVGSESATATADSENEDSSLRRTTVSESRSRNFYLGLDSSSSDSDSEVDEILSAMYSRYKSFHEQAINFTSRPASKKISSVIARGKQQESKAMIARRVPGGSSESVSKKQGCPGRLQRIREDLQHSEDQFLRDNATSMTVLADVIDSFVDNLVPDGSGISRTLSDTNDGHASNDSNLNNSSMAEDSRLIGVPTSQRTKSRSEVSSSSNSRSFPFAVRDSTAISARVGTSSRTSSNTPAPSNARDTGTASVPSSSSRSLQGAHSSNSVKPDRQAFSNGSTSNSSGISAHDITSSNNYQANGNNGVNGKGKKHSTERNENKGKKKMRTSMRDKELRDVPPPSTFSNQTFHSEAVSNTEVQGRNHSTCLRSVRGVGSSSDSTGRKGEVQTKFGASQSKPTNLLIKKPSLLSVASSTVISSSSSSSLSSNPNFTDDSLYFASSSCLETDSSKENQQESEKPKALAAYPENGVNNAVVQFKKSKIKGRHFRAKKVTSDSSSEEER